MKSLFTYFFRDSDWLKKYLIGCSLFIPGVLGTVFNPQLSFMKIAIAMDYFKENVAFVLFLVFMAISIFCGIISIGYIAINNNLRIYKKDSDLPSWSDFKLIFKTGLKLIVLLVLYLLLISLIFPVIVFVFTTIVSLFRQGALDEILPFAMLLSFVFVSILSALVGLTSLLGFSYDLKFSSFFNYKLLYNIVKSNAKSYWVYVILSILGYLFLIIMEFFFYNKIMILAVLIPFINFYVALIFSELLARVLRPLD